LIALVFAAGLVLPGLMAPLPQAQESGDLSQEGGDVYEQVDRFVEVLQYIRAYYVDGTDDEELIRAAVKRMLADLDPHTQFLEGEQYGDLRTGTKGTYTGVGMEVSTRRGYPVVVSPMEGTPAYDAGLQTGDFIVAIDGVDTFGILLQDAVRMLRGPKGAPVSLTVQREGEPERLEFTVVRDVIRIPSIPVCGVLRGDMGYARVSRFSESVAHELETCLDGLDAEGIRGLILDLRGNPGGLLMEAVKVCELFVPEGKLLVSTKGRLSGDSIEYVSGSEKTREIPLVILVGGGTASAAEIVAGAIQDWDLGLIVGEPTFGKGSVQRLMSVDEDKALKLTTSYYFTPSGRCIHRGDPDAAADDTGHTGASAARTPEGEDTTVDPGPEGAERGGVDASGGEHEFMTAGGRKVFGGGGIMPDVIVGPAEVPPLARRIRGRGLFFSFAVDYVGGNEEMEEPTVDSETLEAFKEYLLDEGFSFEEDEFEAAGDAVSVGIRRELARRLKGDAYALLVAAEADAQLAEALRLLKRASDRDHLLRLAEEGGGEKK